MNDPVCSQCDSRCATEGDPLEHEPLANGRVGKCQGCSCPWFEVEADR